jgi:hypothetical protein
MCNIEPVLPWLFTKVNLNDLFVILYFGHSFVMKCIQFTASNISQNISCFVIKILIHDTEKLNHIVYNIYQLDKYIVPLWDNSSKPHKDRNGAWGILPETSRGLMPTSPYMIHPIIVNGVLSFGPWQYNHCHYQKSRLHWRTILSFELCYLMCPQSHVTVIVESTRKSLTSKLNKAVMSVLSCQILLRIFNISKRVSIS